MRYQGGDRSCGIKVKAHAVKPGRREELIYPMWEVGKTLTQVHTWESRGGSFKLRSVPIAAHGSLQREPVGVFVCRNPVLGMKSRLMNAGVRNGDIEIRQDSNHRL